MTVQSPKQKAQVSKRFGKLGLKFWIIFPIFLLAAFLILILIGSLLIIGQVPTQLLMIAMVSFIIIMAPGLLITHKIADRIERITRAAEQVAQAGDLTLRIDDESKDEIGRLVQAFNQMVTNLDHLHQSRDLLSRTMSPVVRHHLIEHGLDFRGITQIVSILFIDIKDFTRITEKYNTEQVVFFLNDYYSSIANQVHMGGGIIGKYGGDSMLAFFGAPAPKPAAKSSMAALLTALALHATIEDLSDRWSILGLPSIRVGMGVSIGPAVAGPVGSKEQFEYTVIGDAVNLASRLQDLTRTRSDYGIILSAEVYKSLEKQIKNQLPLVSLRRYDAMSYTEKVRRPIQLVDLGKVLVKGKKDTTHVYVIPDPVPPELDETASENPLFS